MRNPIESLVDWYIRTYVAWAKRHEPWSYLIDFGSLALAGVALFFMFRPLFGVWVGVAVAAVPAALAFGLLGLLLHAKGKRRLRGHS